MNDEWRAMLYRLDRRMMRKTLKIVDPFIQEENGVYEIIIPGFWHDDKDEIAFSSQSRKKAFKKWKFYERMKWIQPEPPYNKWDRRLDLIANGKRLRVYSCVQKEHIGDFFGKRSEYFCKRLFELEEWWMSYLGIRRDKEWNAKNQRISESNEKYKQKLKEEQRQKEKQEEYTFLDYIWDNIDSKLSAFFGDGEK